MLITETKINLCLVTSFNYRDWATTQLISHFFKIDDKVSFHLLLTTSKLTTTCVTFVIAYYLFFCSNWVEICDCWSKKLNRIIGHLFCSYQPFLVEKSCEVLQLLTLWLQSWWNSLSYWLVWYKQFSPQTSHYTLLIARCIALSQVTWTSF